MKRSKKPTDKARLDWILGTKALSSFGEGKEGYIVVYTFRLPYVKFWMKNPKLGLRKAIDAAMRGDQ